MTHEPVLHDLPFGDLGAWDKSLEVPLARDCRILVRILRSLPLHMFDNSLRDL